MKKLILVALLLGCSSDNTYELKRTSPVLDSLIHIATFDAGESSDYNKGNCEISRDLLQSQPGIVTTFICIKHIHLGPFCF